MREDINDLAYEAGELRNRIEDLGEKFNDAIAEEVGRLDVIVEDYNGTELTIDNQDFDSYDNQMRLKVDTDSVAECFIESRMRVFVKDENNEEVFVNEFSLDGETLTVNVNVEDNSSEANEEKVKEILNDNAQFIAAVKEVSDAVFVKRLEEVKVKDFDHLKKRLAKLEKFEQLLALLILNDDDETPPQ